VGTFTTKLRVANLARPELMEQIDVLVDTRAAFSWISRGRLERLGIAAIRRMPFRTIDGRVLEREMAEVRIASNGYSAPDLVVMAEAGEMEVMGAHSIEGLGLAADPVQHKLVPTVMPALASRRLEAES
jgi:predicted aspartyl protease